MELKNAQLKETKSRMMVTQGWGGGGNGKILVKGYKLPVIRLTSSEHLMYSMVIIANNTELYT